MNILFVCHGNICRSPMAEFVMKRLVSEAGLSEQPQQPAQPETHVRRRHRPQNPPPDGLHPPPGRRGRPMVHRRLRSHLARRIRRLRGTAEIATIHRMKTPQFTEQNRHNSPNKIAIIHRTKSPQFTERNHHNSPNWKEKIFSIC